MASICQYLLCNHWSTIFSKFLTTLEARHRLSKVLHFSSGCHLAFLHLPSGSSCSPPINMECIMVQFRAETHLNWNIMHLEEHTCRTYWMQLLCTQDTPVTQTGYTCHAYRIHLHPGRTRCHTNRKHLLCVHDTPSCHTYWISSKIWKWATLKANFFLWYIWPHLAQKCEGMRIFKLDVGQCVIIFSIWRKFSKVCVLPSTKRFSWKSSLSPVATIKRNCP